MSDSVTRNGGLQTEESEDTERCWAWSPETQQRTAEIRKRGDAPCVCDARECRLISRHVELKLTFVAYFPPYAPLTPKSLKTA